ncbi:LysR family transcriptional regulator [Parapedobacter tibetensis]|uniref:LysR family transcriptional regulator n=1 Tax=Parapedobacter tibetensis TaxID=2972951 RepID=UPI00214DEB71|nr:LysR family transcriptional regulator [Parapedobacter tibetensis]
MTIAQLENFLILTETLNFRKASEQIYIAQPALSRQIQQLEEEVGAELFDRTKKQIKLTPAGVYFKNEVFKLIHQLKQTIRITAQVHTGKAGEIRIGHASSAMHSVLPALLRYMEKEVPNLKASLVEGTNELIFNKLTDNEVDFGFVPNAFVPEGLSSSIVYKENYLLILPKDHLIDQSNFKDLKDCTKEKWILHPQAEGFGYMEEILKIINSYGYAPNIAHRSPNTSSVLRMVEAGLGITMMGKSTIKGFNLNIKAIELKNVPNQLDMKLVWKTERESGLSPLLDMLKQYFGIE